MTITESTDLLPFRVLIVENNRVYRLIHRTNLNNWDYKVYEAEANSDAQDQFQALWKDAEEKAHRFRCHLALVDLRLKSDLLENDKHGKELVEYLAPTVSIIVSAFGNAAIANAIVKSPPDPPWRAYAFVCKADGPSALRPVIQEVERDYWRRRPLEMICADDLKSAAIMQRFCPDDDTAPPDEVDDILRRLFPMATRLKLEAVSPTRQTSGLLLRHRSVVAKVTEDDHRMPQFIKLALKGRSRKEAQNFERVWQHRGSSRLARPEAAVELWDVGGIKYELVDSDTQHRVMTFSTFYTDPQCTARKIGKALDNFEQFWYQLYQLRPEAPEPARQTLLKAYNRSWGNSWCRRLLAYRANPRLERYPEPVAWLGLGNPVEWLIRKVKLAESPKLTCDDSALPDTVLALTHGDLHGDNLFVDTRQDVWVIDYERTGFGPILQDWVELETDILTHLVEYDEVDCADYLQFLIDVLTPQTINLLTLRQPAGRYHKERATIGKLRKLAVKSSGENDGQPYVWGLLFNALFRLTLLLEEYDEWQVQPPEPARWVIAQRSLELGIQRCLVLAGLAAHRLDNWHQVWPPLAWQPAAPPATNPAPPPRPRLKLQLTALQLGAADFRVAALDIADRQPGAASVLPFVGDELVAVMKLLERGGYAADAFSDPQTAALQRLGLIQDGRLAADWCDRIGRQLFTALLPAEGVLRAEFAKAFHQQRAGGELQIAVDEDAARLACYPWEMIHDGYPALPRAELDVVRYINSPRQAQQLAVSGGPCRLLYVSARPRELAQVATDEDAIRQSIAHGPAHDRFVFEPLPQHTHLALKQRLLDDRRPPIHVLHFDGHGTFARRCPHCQQLNWPHLTTCGNCMVSLAHTPPRGWLLFETPNGQTDPIDTLEFLEPIPRSEVRLVVLASCRSARVRGADLMLAGLGPGLILGGVPAVVAMQFPIATDQAIAFNTEFYRALGQQDSLPQAVNRARKMLPEPGRWSPVLYLRSQATQDHLCL